MRQKPKPAPSPAREPDHKSQRTRFAGRDGLAAYTIDPASFPPSRVVYYNEEFVVINDLFPKSAVHLLILPRDPKKNVMRGQEAFDEDPQFLESCRTELKKVKSIVASELSRRFGHLSASERARNAALESQEVDGALPPGRDWEKDVVSGTHANPSMNHLHIHVMSPDLTGDCMKKRNHYLSFTTDFLIGLEEYPLPRQDHRRAYRHFPAEMRCWRCGRNFGDRMAALKRHLEQELEEWVRE